MAQRGPLDEQERRKLQNEFHKGMDAQKRVVQGLFGEDVTYSERYGKKRLVYQRAESETISDPDWKRHFK